MDLVSLNASSALHIDLALKPTGLCAPREKNIMEELVLLSIKNQSVVLTEEHQSV